MTDRAHLLAQIVSRLRHGAGSEFSTLLTGEMCQLVLEPETPDTVTRHIHRLIDRPVRRSIIERHKLRRVPGSVYLDENGEVA